MDWMQRRINGSDGRIAQNFLHLSFHLRRRDGAASPTLALVNNFFRTPYSPPESRHILRHPYVGVFGGKSRLCGIINQTRNASNFCGCGLGLDEARVLLHRGHGGGCRRRQQTEEESKVIEMENAARKGKGAKERTGGRHGRMDGRAVAVTGGGGAARPSLPRE